MPESVFPCFRKKQLQGLENLENTVYQGNPESLVFLSSAQGVFREVCAREPSQIEALLSARRYKVKVWLCQSPNRFWFLAETAAGGSRQKGTGHSIRFSSTQSRLLYLERQWDGFLTTSPSSVSFTLQYGCPALPGSLALSSHNSVAAALAVGLKSVRNNVDCCCKINTACRLVDILAPDYWFCCSGWQQKLNTMLHVDWPLFSRQTLCARGLAVVFPVKMASGPTTGSSLSWRQTPAH